MLVQEQLAGHGVPMGMWCGRWMVAMGPVLRSEASRMTKSVVNVEDLNTGARIQPSSSAELCGRGTKMGSWQKLSLPGDQRCISGSPAASFGDNEILRMSCIATAWSAEFPIPGCSCEILPLGLQTQPLHCYHTYLILVIE